MSVVTDHSGLQFYSDPTTAHVPFHLPPASVESFSWYFFFGYRPCSNPAGVKGWSTSILGKFKGVNQSVTSLQWIRVETMVISEDCGKSGYKPYGATGPCGAQLLLVQGPVFTSVIRGVQMYQCRLHPESLCPDNSSPIRCESFFPPTEFCSIVEVFQQQCFRVLL